MAGPQSDLHSYLGKLKQLDVSIDYLEARRCAAGRHWPFQSATILQNLMLLQGPANNAGGARECAGPAEGCDAAMLGGLPHDPAKEQPAHPRPHHRQARVTKHEGTQVRWELEQANRNDCICRRLASKSVTRRAEKSARLPGPSAPNQRGANGASSSGHQLAYFCSLQCLMQLFL